MPQNDILKRYLEAGVQFTQMTRDRAEAIVKELVRAGEVQREQTQERVEELIDRSRKNTEHLMDLIRREIADQLAGMGLATKDDLRRLETKLAGASQSATAPRAATKAATPGPAKKAAAKKAPAKKG